MILFLDIDGVMLPAISWKKYENLSDSFPAFTVEAVEALNLLMSKYKKITVVLTTSHRYRFLLDEWKEIFKRRGIVIENLSCLEPNETFNLKSRKDEILNWLDSYDIYDDFIIIDDDTSLHGFSKEFKKHLISTSPLIGLKKDLI